MSVRLDSAQAGDTFAHRRSNEVLVIDKPRPGRERVLCAYFSIRDGSFSRWDHVSLDALGSVFFPLIAHGTREEDQDGSAAAVLASWRDDYDRQHVEAVSVWEARHNMEGAVVLSLAAELVPLQKCGSCNDPLDWREDRIVHFGGCIFCHAECFDADPRGSEGGGMKLAKRTLRHVPNVDADSTHPAFTGQRKRSFGFHNPQREHSAKVQHPKPSERVAV